MQTNEIINVVIGGLGGQGILKASDILADAALRAGYDVKKSELHGMSQRGGSVSSDVRFGREVFSPMVPAGEAQFLVITASDQVEPNRHVLRPDGVLIVPGQVDVNRLVNRKSLNVALLGILSAHLPMTEEHWLAALAANLPEKILEINRQAFKMGREQAA